MKKTIKILSLIGLTVLSVNACAKCQAGVYLTPSDYINKHLSYETGSKIHLNNSVWDMPYITVTDNNKKIKLSKNNIFGYVDRDNKVYRFYKNQEYLIAEEGNVIIYIQLEHVSQGKGFSIKKNYFFSTSADGEIIPLTLENIKNAYQNNGRFLDLLDRFFSNCDVTSYDSIHNTFKVNYVYARTLKESLQEPGK